MNGLLRMRPALWLAAAALFAATEASAHGVGMSQVNVRIDGTRIEGDWELNLRDARWAVGLDTTLTGAAGFADLMAHDAELRALLERSIVLTAEGRKCAFTLTPAPLEWMPDPGAVKYVLAATCPVEPTRLGMRCDLLFDLDPSHRTYFIVQDSRASNVGVLWHDARSVTIAVRQFHAKSVFVEFLRAGAMGFAARLDHVLFLVALLLPAGLLRAGRDWAPRPGDLWPTARECLIVAAAFAIGHSIAMVLGFAGWVRPAAQWVSVGLAISVFVAAWNNLRPIRALQPRTLALSLGTIHGIALSGALGNLTLPRHAHPLAFGAYTVGIELAQLAIVVLLAPVLHAGSRRRWYPRWGMGLGSLAIAWLAVIWIIQRALVLELFARR